MSLFATWIRTRLAMPTLHTRRVASARSEQSLGADGFKYVRVAHAQRRAARAEIEYELIALDLEQDWAREEERDAYDYQAVLDDNEFYDSITDEELEELEMAHFRHKYGLEDFGDEAAVASEV